MFVLNCNDPSLANFMVVFRNVINFLLILAPILFWEI